MMGAENRSLKIKTLIFFLSAFTVLIFQSCNQPKLKSNIKFVLIGERHGVEEQQIRIAGLISDLANIDSNIAIVMEMIDADQEKLVQVFATLSPDSLDDF